MSTCTLVSRIGVTIRYGWTGFVVALVQTALALNPSQQISQYAHSSWATEEGRVAGSALAVAQTTDGGLWIGTEFGLLQFDGVRFVRWRPPQGQQLSSDYVTALSGARDGSLWIGTRAGLSHWAAGRIENYPTRSGPAGPGVAVILQARDGTVWAGTIGYRSGGLCRVQAGLLQCEAVTGGGSDFGVSALLEDRHGNLWVGGTRGLGVWKSGPPRLDPSYASSSTIGSVVEDSQGGIWGAAPREGGLARLMNGKLAPFPLDRDNRNVRPRALLSDRDGGLWIGTFGQGLLHLRSDGRFDRFSKADGLSDDEIQCLFEDREGNVWAATDSGLDRFREYAVATVTKREGLSDGLVSSLLLAQNGDAWIGTNTGLNRVPAGKSFPESRRVHASAASITGIFQEQLGRLWVDSGAGLAFSDHGEPFHSPGQSTAASVRSVTAEAEDPEHNVWLSNPELGLVKLQGGRIVNVFPWSQFNNRHAWALCADPKSGGLWLGFSPSGLAYFQPGRPIRWFGAADGLADGAVVDLHFSGDGTLWIATEAGLSRLRGGKIATLNQSTGLPCDQPHALVEDDRGALWLNSACGLVRIAAADLAAWTGEPNGRIPVRVYDASDGMRRHGAHGGYFARAGKSRDGRLWFAVFEGVAIVDPSRLRDNPQPPPVRIEQVIADRKAYPAGSYARLPSLTKDLQIDYTAFSFVAPDKVRFRYRLEGRDADWQEAGTRRQALYTNLPPGNYEFRVIACNNDQLWNTTGASYRFSIPPAFYQTSWFALLCGSALFLGLLGLYRLRVRQIGKQLQLRFEERLAERTRIARDLHDTLLQNIAGFALQLGGLAKTVSGPPLASQRLHDLREQAEHWLREARESVWDLRSPDLEREDLVSALRHTGEQFTVGQAIRYELTFNGKPRPVPANLQEQLLKIIREAIRNTVRHAQATEIHMRVAYLEPGRILVELDDNGCGFDLAEASQKDWHWGLAGMRERAQRMGGDLKISSAPGHGTKIEISIPIAPSTR